MTQPFPSRPGPLPTRPRLRPHPVFAVLLAAMVAWMRPAPAAGQAPAAAGGSPRVVISEFLAENDSGLRDDDGDRSDWIELHNPGDVPVALGGLSLTDDPARVRRWELPAVSLPAGGYLVVFASGKDRRPASGPSHAGFKLGAKGDYLALVDADGRTVLQEFSPAYPRQKADVSFGLAPSWRPGAPVAAHLVPFVSPTPGRPNGPAQEGEVGRIRWSARGGFHEAPVRIEISTATPGAVIRYTLDGTTPTMSNGTVYEGPVTVSRTTVLRAAAFRDGFRPARPATRTFLFAADIVRQSPDGLPPESFPYEWGLNQVDYGMDPRVADDPRYREEILRGLRALPSVSLVMDLDDLFGAARGIYANPGEQGREWERPCSIEYLTADGSPGFQEDCGLRIRGGFSRMPVNAKHAFRVFFRDEYGASRLKYPLFGPGGAQEFENFDLRTFQNYSWSLARDRRATFLRDQFHRDLQAAMGQPAARGGFCHLYLNGQYWGLYNTCERIEASYGATTFGGRKSDYDAVKVDSGFTTRASTYQLMATDGDLGAWTRLYRRASAGLADNGAYFALQGRGADGFPAPGGEVLLDVDNLIDYMLVIFWGGNLDAPITAFGGNRAPNNWHGIRSRAGREGFRFFVWDAEHTLLDVQEDRTGPFRTGDSVEWSSPQWLWQRCLDNAEFRLRVADRIHRHFGEGGVLEPAELDRRFRARAAQIESAVVCESARWGDVLHGVFEGPTPDRPMDRDLDWREEVRRITTGYLPRRSDIVRAQLYRQGVIPDVAPPGIGPGGRLGSPTPGAVVWHTTDGTDPRQVGGQPAPGAVRGEVPAPPGGFGPGFRARAVLDGDWSPLVAGPPGRF